MHVKRGEGKEGHWEMMQIGRLRFPYKQREVHRRVDNWVPRVPMLLQGDERKGREDSGKRSGAHNVISSLRCLVVSRFIVSNFCRITLVTLLQKWDWSCSGLIVWFIKQKQGEKNPLVSTSIEEKDERYWVLFWLWVSVDSCDLVVFLYHVFANYLLCSIEGVCVFCLSFLYSLIPSV